ncbi:MAG: ATP-binding protein [Deltaproteobacteria bacterium]|nr:ATP-binding protein [Deltaproteobacteria bacterium]
MNKEQLTEIFFDQKEIFNAKKGLIDRAIDLSPYINTSQIVVITGVRRCGKSSLLFLLKQKMQLNDNAFCYFNFDDERIGNKPELLEQIDNLHKELYNKDAVLFFDEIQNINGWEKFINRLYEQGRKIFITGSNASLLSSEISTTLTGRNKTLELFPFSFKEYLNFIKLEFNLKTLSANTKVRLTGAFDTYLKSGGFPMVIRENDPELLDNYFKDILYRDIIARYRISQVDEIKQLGLYFFSNIAKIFSYSTLQKITGIKSLSTVKNYLDYFSMSYLFFYLRKFDYSVKKQILNSRKVYSVDHGFANRLGFNFSKNRGRILENMVLIELLRNNKEVFYHSGKKECDFVVRQGFQITEAIQVAYHLNKENVEREVSGLLEAMEKFNLKKGLILTYDTDIDAAEIPETIKIIPVWKWLLTGNK